MGKKNKKTSKEDFDRGLMSKFYGPGKEAQDMLKRYGVEGYSHGRTDRGSEYRGVDEVKKDLANAMMNDYDTRRTMEAAAMAGNKDAKKFAKKGFKSGNLQDAYGVMRDLKKEYVGGGGMDGAKNRAGLTYAMVKEDRRVHNEDIDARIAANTPELPEEDPDKGFTDPQQLEQSKAVTDAKERASRFEAGMSAYGGDDEQDAAAVTPASTEPGKADSMLDAFKQKLKEDRNFKHSF